MNTFFERILYMALSQVMDVEANPADVAGVWHPLPAWHCRVKHHPIRLVPAAAAQLATGACSIVSGLRDWTRSRRLMETWSANTPRWASLGELGWEGCADEEILLCSCGLNPLLPQQHLPSNQPPAPRNLNPPPYPPPPPANPPNPKNLLRRSASPWNRATPPG